MLASAGHCAWRRLCLAAVKVGLIAVPLVGHGANDAGPLRVAMMDFTTDDGLVRSAAGAAQWTALTQDGLARQEPAVVWIERAQLQLAADELHLSAGGFTSADGSLQVGAWLKADLAILGRFNRNGKENDGHTLRLEIVDLRRADTLAVRTLPVAGDRRDAVTLNPALIPASVGALHDALAEARQKLARANGQKIVAPLFFRNTDPSPRLNHFESDLSDTFARSADATRDVGVLRFPQADAARGEAELAVRGLAESDAGAWQRVADLYVWGSYHELPAPAGAGFAQTPVEIELTLWDGSALPCQWTERATVAELPALARRLADRAIDAARQVPAMRAGASPPARDEVARRLREQGERLEEMLSSQGLRRDDYTKTTEGSQIQRQERLLLGTACFFEPEDLDARLAYLRALWTAFPSPSQRLPLLDLWRRSNDLADFAERSGGARAGDDPGHDLARNCVDADGFLQLRFAYGVKQIHVPGSEPNLPLDASEADLAAWHTALDARFARDVLAYTQTAAAHPALNAVAAHESYPIWMQTALHLMQDKASAARVVEDLWPLYKTAYEKNPAILDRLNASEGGLPGALDALFRSIHQPERTAALLGSLTPSGLAPAQPVAVSLPTPPLRVSVVALPKFTPVLRTLPFPQNPNTPRDTDPGSHGAPQYVIHSLAVGDDDQLWVSAFHRPGYLGNAAFGAETEGLWRFDPADESLQEMPVPGLTAQTPITSILPQGDRLWLAVDFTGVSQYDSVREQVSRRWTVVDGLVTSNVDAGVAAGAGSLYFAGHEKGQRLLSCFDPDRRDWSRVGLPTTPDTALPPGDPNQPPVLISPATQIVACGRWLLVGRDRNWTLVDTLNHGTRDLRDAVPAALRSCVASADPAWRPAYTMDMRPLRCPRQCAADARGFWLALPGKLLRFDPAHPDRAKLWPLPAEMENGITALAADGDQVWIVGPRQVRREQASTFGANAFRALLPHLARNTAIDGGAFVAVLHEPDGEWQGGFEVPALVSSMAVSRQTVYLGLQGETQPLFEIDKRATLATAVR